MKEHNFPSSSASRSEIVQSNDISAYDSVSPKCQLPGLRRARAVWTSNSRKINTAPSTALGTALDDQLRVIPIGTEILRDGSFLELVRNSSGPALLHCSSGRSATAMEWVFGGCRYVPTEGAALV